MKNGREPMRRNKDGWVTRDEKDKTVVTRKMGRQKERD